jgi:hypothetical protein
MREKRVPVAIERVRSQFAEWRAQKSARDRIPERLWCAAVEAARRHGVHAVSRAARLEHSTLRLRVEKAAGQRPAAATFIELDNEASTESVGCIVELEKGNGTRMRICVRDGAAVDWARMKEAFLGA